MKTKNFLYYILFAILISGCNCNSSKKKSKSLSIQKTDELMFRRSYAGHERMTDEQVEKLQMERPTSGYNGTDNTNLRNKLTGFGFVEGNELLLDKFKYDTVSTFQIKNQANDSVQVKFERVSSTDFKNMLTVTGNGETVVLNLSDSVQYNSLQDLKYAVLDIIPGGYPEIVLLNQWYIANGDNYEFMIFEINPKSKI